ncbi:MULTISPECIES: DoxX family protein [Streptomyces]|uniref:DoxX family protein n=1 Tax=Streptomyces solicathayae TaxID=3081768 RepID=A0ABZ0LZT3_9ACTN|nr:DoxX family protein [Streptomyces sp. HUAS YS2]WOX25027.1 DoxX family protein [Streptomyces sp. HUAS YS2]
MTALTPETTVASAPLTVPGKRLSRRADISVRVLQIVLALFFAIPSASPKLVGHASAAEGFDKIGWGDWFMYTIGGLELAGAIALVIPVLSSVAATALIGLMVGAFVFTLTFFDGQFWFTPVIFAVLLAVVAWNRREQNARLFALLSRRA